MEINKLLGLVHTGDKIDFESVASRVDQIDRVDCKSTARSTESTVPALQ